MSLIDYIKYRKILRQNRNNPTVLKLKEFYKECKFYIYRIRFKRWIDFYDIETVFEYMLMNPEMSEFTTEIMIRLQLNIEEYRKKVKTKNTPLKALRILIDVARKSIVI